MGIKSSIVAAALIVSVPLQVLAEDGGSSAVIIAKLRAAASARGLPPDIAEAVGFVETAFDPSQIGAAGEIGVMQVMPMTAAGLGFVGTNAELADVDVNIRYGTRYLASAWVLAGHDLCRTLNKYRAGHNSDTLSPASVAYCRRALAYLASKHSEIAEGVETPIVARASTGDAPQAAGTSGKGAGRATGFWAREEARVRTLRAKVKERWALIAAHNARVEQSGARATRKTAQLAAELRALR